MFFSFPLYHRSISDQFLFYIHFFIFIVAPKYTVSNDQIKCCSNLVAIILDINGSGVSSAPYNQYKWNNNSTSCNWPIKTATKSAPGSDPYHRQGTRPMSERPSGHLLLNWARGCLRLPSKYNQRYTQVVHHRGSKATIVPTTTRCYGRRRGGLKTRSLAVNGNSRLPRAGFIKLSYLQCFEPLWSSSTSSLPSFLYKKLPLN